jgi:hypothetical protein
VRVKRLEDLMTTKTVVGAFDDDHDADRAVHALINDGFMEREISVVARDLADDEPRDGSATYAEERAEAQRASREDAANPLTDPKAGALTGGLLGGAAGLAASLVALALPGVGPVVVVGPLVAALSGAGVGAVAGGLFAALTTAGVSETHANYYVEVVRRGGAVVTLRTDDTRTERAAELMRENGAIDIDERVTRWREQGWSEWDVSAAPYTRDEAERERRLYGSHADPLTGLPTTGAPERDTRQNSTIRR